MSTLHILNKPLSDGDCWRDCLASCADGDTLLLIESGVYGAAARPAELPSGCRFCALQADIEARGLKAEQLAAEIVDDTGFVALACKHSQTLSWF
ncbi:sulfurtransferase complex subunit TusB [Marinobacterium arenosum]|uniref:sulfurtransferase complex subunit TusB n=1 Tax=Marinobacterium arenosum TaxID=2862496 RepID=UPI001C956BFE|nr:sulfurtransferase complex subunit TusB [Marinobacterium arenosum]MBY4677192.1 sulfurtransferase complex subunit TusB [Marinobacterium arenosum]